MKKTLKILIIMAVLILSCSALVACNNPIPATLGDHMDMYAFTSLGKISRIDYKENINLFDNITIDGQAYTDFKITEEIFVSNRSYGYLLGSYDGGSRFCVALVDMEKLSVTILFTSIYEAFDEDRFNYDSNANVADHTYKVKRVAFHEHTDEFVVIKLTADKDAVDGTFGRSFYYYMIGIDKTVIKSSTQVEGLIWSKKHALSVFYELGTERGSYIFKSISDDKELFEVNNKVGTIIVHDGADYIYVNSKIGETNIEKNIAIYSKKTDALSLTYAGCTIQVLDARQGIHVITSNDKQGLYKMFDDGIVKLDIAINGTRDYNQYNEFFIYSTAVVGTEECYNIATGKKIALTENTKKNSYLGAYNEYLFYVTSEQVALMGMITTYLHRLNTATGVDEIISYADTTNYSGRYFFIAKQPIQITYN